MLHTAKEGYLSTCEVKVPQDVRIVRKCKFTVVDAGDPLLSRDGNPLPN